MWNIDHNYIHKALKSTIAEILPKNTTLLAKKPSITILASEICKFAQI